MESWKKFLKEGYYKIDPADPPSLQDVIDGWQRGDKSRGPEAKTSSPEKWDNLKKSIEEEGVKETLIFQVGKNGVAKVAEGNHRLAIAKELGIDKVPVKFLFFDTVELAPQSFRSEEDQ
jgi:ParB-like chromosome segregation protein Spo0J